MSLRLREHMVNRLLMGGSHWFLWGRRTCPSEKRKLKHILLRHGLKPFWTYQLALRSGFRRLGEGSTLEGQNYGLKHQ